MEGLLVKGVQLHRVGVEVQGLGRVWRVGQTPRGGVEEATLIVETLKH